MPTNNQKGTAPKQRPSEETNKSGAHTQAGQQSQTGGGSRQHGHDRADAGKGGDEAKKTRSE
jgi:hypothetical protein